MQSGQATRVLLTAAQTAIMAVAGWLAAAGLWAAESPLVPRWGRWEGEFEATQKAPTDLEFQAEVLAPDGSRRQVSGFLDGGAQWCIRLMPDQLGVWRYTTWSRPPVTGLDRQQGRFTCVQKNGDNRFLRHGAVCVKGGGEHHFVHADGTPFFWLGDTVWTGPAISTAEDWSRYLEDRRAKRFTVVQYNALAPWRVIQTDAEGHPAFTGSNPIRLDPQFFRRLDARLEEANRQGLAGAHVLIWSNSAKDPGKFLGEEDLIRLARYQVARYSAYHVFWILAGDDQYAKSGPMWRRIGQAVFGSGPHAPVTVHPCGKSWPWHDWRDEHWLDFLGYQSGHGDGDKVWQWLTSGPVAQSWRDFGARPIINLEPPYEDHLAYQSHQPQPASNVRRAVWWSLLIAPPAGVTYGAHGLWSWQTVGGQVPADHAKSGVAKVWHEAMALPGSRQMQYVVELLDTLDWWRLRPAQDLLAEQPGESSAERFVALAASPSHDLAVAYLPAGGTIRLKTGEIASLPARWYNPRSGQWGGDAPCEASSSYRAPDQEDWVLVWKARR